MRQGQQHRRGRSRGGQGNHSQQHNNQNRKGQNPLSRSYQSSGPDGKVSGTAQSVAEKYLTLARDAHSSGDPVLAENYLQHAEHYNRIILAYREQLQQGAPEDGGQSGQGRVRPQGQAGGTDAGDEGTEEEGAEPYGRDFQPLPPMEPRPRQNDPQPRLFEGPREGNRDGNRQDGNRPEGGNRFEERQPRQQRDRFQPRDRYSADRGERGDRPDRGDRFNGERANGNRGERYPYDRGERSERQQSGERAPRDRDPGFAERPRTPDVLPAAEGFAQPAPRPDIPAVSEGSVPRPPRPVRRERPATAAVGEHEQPDFLRRPVRRPRREAASEEGTPPPAASTEPESSES